jgi:hypothetical protein
MPAQRTPWIIGALLAIGVGVGLYVYFGAAVAPEPTDAQVRAALADAQQAWHTENWPAVERVLAKDAEILGLPRDAVLDQLRAQGVRENPPGLVGHGIEVTGESAALLGTLTMPSAFDGDIERQVVIAWKRIDGAWVVTGAKDASNNE